MNKLQAEDKVRAMVGKTFMFNQLNHNILRYDVTEDSIRIITDLKDIKLPFPIEPSDLNEFLPVISEKAVSIVQDEAVSIMLPDLLIHKKGADLSEIIFENIRLLKENPEKNIAQASAINDQVKSFMDICKVEVDAAKVAVIMHKGR